MDQQDEQHKCITSKDAIDNITEADSNTLRVQIEITWYNSIHHWYTYIPAKSYRALI